MYRATRLNPGTAAGRLICWLPAALLLTLLSGAVAADEFLLPEQAFQVSAAMDGPDRVRLDWTIADGYYLYRSKFRFQTETPGIALGDPALPASERRQDEFFGQVEIQRGAFAIQLPIQRTDGAGETLALELGYQGCAEAGFCYPPQRQTLNLALPALAAAETAVPPPMPRAASSPAPAARAAPSLGFGVEDDPLPVEEAFRFQAEVLAPDRLALTWDIAPGTYLYADSLKIALENTTTVAIAPFERPPGEIKRDSILPDGRVGEVEIHHDRIELALPLLRRDLAPADLTLVVRYQGCAEIGFCYPPQTARVPLSLAPAAAATEAPEPAAATTGIADSMRDQPPLAEQDRIAAVLADRGLWTALAIFFGFGLLLAFTPCVFPMIPILSGIIVGQGASLTTRRAFVLSLVYVLAMALTYTLAGVLAGLLGANLQAAFQHPAILSAFALIFVLLALSMFGFYELQLPSVLQSRLAGLSNRQTGGTPIGAAVMGLLSALIVGPCVAPPLFGALIYIGQTGDALLGGLALFALSLGMGAPLIVIGTSAGRLLPRAGAWMETVKAVFGVAMLAVAILLLERLLPAAVALALWGLLSVCSAVYLGALTALPPDASGWRKLWKGLGLVLLIQGTLLLIGAAAGGHDRLQPLRGLSGAPDAGGAAALQFAPVKTIADLERALDDARAAGRPALLDFYADWCVSCKELERETFTDPAVIAALRPFVLLRADVTANDADDRALQGRFGLPGPPALLFFDPTGAERPAWRRVGFVAPADFVAHLRRVSP